MSHAAWVLAAGFGGWLAATVACQFNSRLARALRRRDPLLVIPQWTFFAPEPAVTDYHVLYRDEYSDGTHSGWMELVLDPKPACRAVWNVHKRRSKALFDLVQGLLTLLADDPRAEVKYTVGYVLLLQAVSREPRGREPARTQFVVVESSGYTPSGPPRVVLRSEPHRL